MADMEKVLHGLSSCGNDYGIPNICKVTECPYRGTGAFCSHNLAHDANMLISELLKAQEARVLTLAEALAADYVYLEIRLHASLPCDCCILAIDPDGGILPLHKGFCAYLDGEDYGIDWRCWTARPTEEQREATPWQVI